jgi:iron complex transport system ATP-binding protein
VLESASFQVDPGQIVGLLGANGAGKSTLIAAVAGEIASSAGDVSFDGMPLGKMSVLQQAQCRAVLPQSPGLSFDLSVDQVLQMGRYPFEGLVSADALDASQTFVIQALSLDPIFHRSYLALSGGEQQRVHLARVMVQVEAALIVHDHAYLLLDEPLSSLDPAFQFEWMSFLSRYTRERKVGVLMALHDVNLAARWCDSILLMSKRQLEIQGSPKEVLTTEHLFATYGLNMQVMPHPLSPGRLLVLSP